VRAGCGCVRGVGVGGLRKQTRVCRRKSARRCPGDLQCPGHSAAARRGCALQRAML